MLVTVEHLVPAQDVGGLAHRETEVGPLERNVAEAHRRSAGLLLRRQPFRVGLNPRQRHPRLHPALGVHQVDLHVDRRRQLGLRSLQLSQFENFARFGAGRTGWLAGLMTFGHRWIVE